MTLPPRWGPQNGTELLIRRLDAGPLNLVILSDMDPARQCAAIVKQLEGSARMLARQMTFDDITRGGVIGGQQQDPVMFLLTHVAQQFAPLGEESRLRYVNELMNCDRLPRESTDDMLTRYMIVRFRAQHGPGNPQLGMSWETVKMLLLRACRVNNDQYIQRLSPFLYYFTTFGSLSLQRSSQMVCMGSCAAQGSLSQSRN